MFINNDWLAHMPCYIANFLPEGISYHSPIKVEVLNADNKPRRPFKYCNIWAIHPSFMERVEAVWHTLIQGYTMLQIVKKLKLLNKRLTKLNKQHFNNILAEVEEDKMALDQVQKGLQLNPTDQLLQQQEREQYHKFRRSSYLAESFPQQRSKAKWIKLGDDNSRYFFQLLNIRIYNKL